LFQLGRI